MIYFWVKEGAFPRVNFVGKTFLPLEKIPFRNGKESLNRQIQTKLPFCKSKDSKLLDILKRRKSDPAAKYFVKIQRQKLSTCVVKLEA
jgi:hypothetical protein